MKRMIMALPSLTPGAAFAHAGEHAHRSEEAAFLLGLTHPFGGADHLIAMLAVGLLAAVRGGRALWAVPITFISAVWAGAVLVSAELAPLATEPAIFASVLLLGAAVALTVRPPFAAELMAIALVGLVHGAAHGAAAPADGLIAYGVGLATATAALLLGGIGAGTALARAGQRVPQLLGGATALVGLALVLAP